MNPATDPDDPYERAEAIGAVAGVSADAVIDRALAAYAVALGVTEDADEDLLPDEEPASVDRRAGRRFRSTRPDPVPEPGTTLPRYLTMERLEARLPLAQAKSLDGLVRRLNDARPRGVGERITVNTLLRVAADLLLARAGEIAGTTEAELRASVGLPRHRPERA